MTRFFDYPRASRLMVEKGIDVLLVQNTTNTVYLSDHQCPWVSPTLMLEDGRTWYETFVGVACSPDIPPFIVTTLGEEGHLLHSDTWIKDVRYWGTPFVIEGRAHQMAFANDAVEATAQALTERGLATSCIGVELDQIPVRTYQRLRERLPRALFVDAWPVLWDMRSIKDAEEVRRMRRAALASERAIATAFSAARAGMTELEMESLLAQIVASEGCRFEWASVAFGTKGAVMVGATEKRLQPDEILRIDLVASYRGWLSDMSRNAVFGQPSREMRDAHDAVWRTNQLVRSAIRPGVPCEELFRLGNEYMLSRGYRMLTEQVGHGVGRSSNEPPFLTRGNSSCLEAGMVVTVEIPLRLTSIGSINIEDLLLVTPDGNEPLTLSSGELYQLTAPA